MTLCNRNHQLGLELLHHRRPNGVDRGENMNWHNHDDTFEQERQWSVFPSMSEGPISMPMKYYGHFNAPGSSYAFVLPLMRYSKAWALKVTGPA